MILNISQPIDKLENKKLFIESQSKVEQIYFSQSEKLSSSRHSSWLPSSCGSSPCVHLDR